MELGVIFLMAVGLMLILEGGLYALFPKAMKQTLASLLAMPDKKLRDIGLITVAVGAGLLLLVL